MGDGFGSLEFLSIFARKKFFSCYFGFQYNPEGWDGEREAGGRIRIGNTCKSMADSCQCMAKTTTIKKKKLKKKEILTILLQMYQLYPSITFITLVK